MKNDMVKKWRIATVDEQLQQNLAKDLNVRPVVAKLLLNRGIADKETGKEFLESRLDALLSPFTMKGVERAVNEIENAIAEDRQIVVYGDYDVDGITATSLLYRFLKRLGAKVSYYIPERQSEGYGLNLEALRHIKAEGADLVITVDCGISSYDIVEEVREELGMIITDHHMPPEQIPRALAVINPKQPGCPYKDKNLSGVGVAFKLCQGVWLRRTGEWYLEDLDIVALGTVADLVPLIGENRVLVKAGLERIMEAPNMGIRALIEVAMLQDKEITTGHIGFTLAPRLNAAGRVTHATRGVQLLITEEPEEAAAIAQELQETNAERQQIERQIHEAARADVLAQGEEADKVIVVAGQAWHSGVIGIVASRLVEEFYRPTLMISVHDGIGKGSCRSIDSFNMYEALREASDLLLQFGGHHQAAGFSILEENIPLLRKRLQAYCERVLTEEDYIPVVEVDALMEPAEIDVALIEEISALEPYGMGNSTPVFAMTEATAEEIYVFGAQKNHCKVLIANPQGDALEALAWQGENYRQCIFPRDTIRLAFSLQRNEWQGRVRPQLMIQDIRVLQEQRAILTPENLRLMYMFVKHAFKDRSIPRYILESECIYRHPPEVTEREAVLALTVFKELGILKEEQAESGMHLYQWCHVQGKLDLITSLTFLKYSAKEG